MPVLLAVSLDGDGLGLHRDRRYRRHRGVGVVRADVDDVAARFLEGTPFHNDILDAGGAPLLQEARRLLASNVAGFAIVDLADHVPEWAGVDNPDGLAKGLLFPTNTCLYVTAGAP